MFIFFQATKIEKLRFKIPYSGHKNLICEKTMGKCQGKQSYQTERKIACMRYKRWIVSFACANLRFTGGDFDF